MSIKYKKEHGFLVVLAHLYKIAYHLSKKHFKNSGIGFIQYLFNKLACILQYSHQ